MGISLIITLITGLITEDHFRSLNVVDLPPGGNTLHCGLQQLTLFTLSGVFLEFFLRLLWDFSILLLAKHSLNSGKVRRTISAFFLLINMMTLWSTPTIQYRYTANSAVVRIQNEYDTLINFVKHPLYLSVSAVGLHIMLPPPVSLTMS